MGNDLMERELLIQEKNTFVKRNSARLINVRKDYAEAILEVTEKVKNPFGFAHGGALFMLADFCAGVVARTDGRHYVTQTANVSYLRPGRDGELTAKGTVISRNGTHCLIEVSIADEEEKLLFTGTFTYFCTER